MVMKVMKVHCAMIVVMKRDVRAVIYGRQIVIQTKILKCIVHAKSVSIKNDL